MKSAISSSDAPPRPIAEATPTSATTPVPFVGGARISTTFHPQMGSSKMLFDDSDSDLGEDNLPVNEDYGRRMEHNRRREDLQRLQELEKQGLLSSPTSSSSSSSEDDASGASPRTNLQFFDALVKVKRKDPIIHQKDAKLYSSNSSDENVDNAKPRKKERLIENERPLYIKDVTARHLLENGPELEDNEKPEIQSQAKVYSKEQEENRRRFLEAAESGEDEEGGDFFSEKPLHGEPTLDDEGDVEVLKKMDEYWGEDGNLDEEELFLKNFLSKKMWIGKGGGDDDDDGNAAFDHGEELSEDEDELERQEKYEAEYNFRHEEGVGDVVMGHSREVEGSVRKKKSNARKEQRKRKEERMAQAEKERREEVKRLKNVKKKEISERLERIRVVAGIGDGGGCKLGVDDLEEEFDPDEYDKKMKEMFGMDYYNAEDVDPEFGSGDEGGLEKPDFGREDELLGLPKGWDVIGGGEEGFKAARDRMLKSNKDEVEGEARVEEEEEEEECVADGDQQQGEGKQKKKRKRKISLREKVELDKELEEYYKLDYEDSIGDLKTRFKYKSVQANRYGLGPAEILMADDGDLNQYVSLKKLAPYRQDEWNVHKAKMHQMKMKLYDRGEVAEELARSHKKKHLKACSNKSGNEDADNLSNGQASGQDLPSRRSRRRRRQSELKLSQSRLMAYGKISHNPKKKKKKH